MWSTKCQVKWFWHSFKLPVKCINLYILFWDSFDTVFQPALFENNRFSIVPMVHMHVINYFQNSNCAVFKMKYLLILLYISECFRAWFKYRTSSTSAGIKYQSWFSKCLITITDIILDAREDFCQMHSF